MAKSKKPRSPDEITNSWLTDTQRGSGKLTDDSLTLVHGDYHPGNIFFQSNNEGRFAVFDWEAVHNGCAGEDLARIITLGIRNPHFG